MKIKLDRTMCDGFGKCAERAPAVFDLDEWGYASYAKDVSPYADLPADAEAPARRALMDCPVHAITERPAAPKDAGPKDAGPDDPGPQRA